MENYSQNVEEFELLKMYINSREHNMFFEPSKRKIRNEIKRKEKQKLYKVFSYMIIKEAIEFDFISKLEKLLQIEIKDIWSTDYHNYSSEVMVLNFNKNDKNYYMKIEVSSPSYEEYAICIKKDHCENVFIDQETYCIKTDKDDNKSLLSELMCGPYTWDIEKNHNEYTYVLKFIEDLKPEIDKCLLN